MAEEEKILAEKIDGVIVALPASKVGFYLEKAKTMTGREEVSVTPLVLPEERMKGIIESIKSAVTKKKEAVKEAT